MSLRSARARSAGFTLVEILVALLLTALVMTSVFGVLHDGLAARDRIHNLSQLQRTGPLILDRIEADLRALTPFNVGGRKVFLGRTNAINGSDADSFDFVALQPATVEVEARDRLLRPRLCELGYHLRQNPNERMFLELWRREDPHLDSEPFTGGTFTKLYDKITNFNVTYFSEAGTNARAEDAWASEERGVLPQRIQIDIELEIEPRVESSGREADLRRRRSFRRIINLDQDLNRILLADLRPMIPDVPKADETPTTAGPPGQGGVPGGAPGMGGAGVGVGKKGGGGGGKGSGGATFTTTGGGGGGMPPGFPGAGGGKKP